MAWRQWGVAAYRVCAWISGSRSGNLLLSLLWIRQDCEEREMSEQLGAKEATTVTEQSADWQKQVSCFFLSHVLLPIWSTHTHAHTQNTFGGQAVGCFHPAAGRYVTDPNGISY